MRWLVVGALDSFRMGLLERNQPCDYRVGTFSPILGRRVSGNNHQRPVI